MFSLLYKCGAIRIHLHILIAQELNNSRMNKKLWTICSMNNKDEITLFVSHQVIASMRDYG